MCVALNHGSRHVNFNDLYTFAKVTFDINFKNFMLLILLKGTPLAFKD